MSRMTIRCSDIIGICTNPRHSRVLILQSLNPVPIAIHYDGPVVIEVRRKLILGQRSYSETERTRGMISVTCSEELLRSSAVHVSVPSERLDVGSSAVFIASVQQRQQRDFYVCCSHDGLDGYQSVVSATPFVQQNKFSILSASKICTFYGGHHKGHLDILNSQLVLFLPNRPLSH